MCFTKGCESYRKSIRRDQLEGEFDDVLRALQPGNDFIAIATIMFKHAWKQQSDQLAAVMLDFKSQIKEIDKKIDALVERLVDASSDRVVSACAKKLDELEREKLILAEKMEEKPSKTGSFDELFELATMFLANPCNIYIFGDLMYRKMVLRMVFSERPTYCRKKTSNPKNYLAVQGIRGN